MGYYLADNVEKGIYVSGWRDYPSTVMVNRTGNIVGAYKSSTLMSLTSLGSYGYSLLLMPSDMNVGLLLSVTSSGSTVAFSLHGPSNPIGTGTVLMTCMGVKQDTQFLYRNINIDLTITIFALFTNALGISVILPSVNVQHAIFLRRISDANGFSSATSGKIYFINNINLNTLMQSVTYNSEIALSMAEHRNVMELHTASSGNCIVKYDYTNMALSALPVLSVRQFAHAVTNINTMDCFQYVIVTSTQTNNLYFVEGTDYTLPLAISHMRCIQL